ncbi:UPAR/Ly6 domain-containing protein bero-like [Haematobia irritans]|uniref:UPAR/Ly6 domain-containing protein bero-like n=1 Tax=Haematobia irritans TaxID=7368 RepID=UPI003F505B6C
MRYFLLVALLCTFLASVWAIKCYECDSMTTPQCNEYFSPKGVEESDCDEDDMPDYLKKYGVQIEATGCLTKIHEGIEGQRYFIRRSCYFGSLENTKEACDMDDPYLPYADLIDCQVCSEDLCNTDASPQSMPSWYTVGAFVVALILSRLW